MSAYKQAALMRCNYSSHIPRLAISKRSGEPVHVVYFANPMGFRMVRKTKLQVPYIGKTSVSNIFVGQTSTKFKLMEILRLQAPPTSQPCDNAGISLLSSCIFHVICISVELSSVVLQLHESGTCQLL